MFKCYSMFQFFVALQNGFQFHHAKPGYLMMYCWLPASEVCNILPFAHTMIGVGAVLPVCARNVRPQW